MIGGDAVTQGIKKTRPVGRSLRLIVGAMLMFVAVPVYFRADWTYGLASLGVVVALTLFYALMHHAISRYLPNVNRWLGAALAVTPVFLVWLFGQGGGPIFGQGEGGTAAITFIGLSLLVDFARADPGCEVMAFPGLMFGNRTHLACIALSPVDALEEKLSARPEAV
jgi:hypothetical protein